MPNGQTTGAAGRRVIAAGALTAVAGGDLSWAATYDAVVDRFAFHDDLADVPEGSAALATYYVAGWWSDPALDPLHDATTLGLQRARLRARLARTRARGLSDSAKEREATGMRRERLESTSPPLLGSGLAATGDKGAKVDLTMAPDHLIAETGASGGERGRRARQTLVHGVVFGVALDGSGPDQLPAAEALEVALGPTAFGSLPRCATAATAARRRRAPARGVLRQPAGHHRPAERLVAADEDRHASAFVAASGGLRSQPDRVTEGDPLVPPGGGRPASAPAPAPSTGPKGLIAAGAGGAARGAAATAV